VGESKEEEEEEKEDGGGEKGREGRTEMDERVFR
jgi:hypothetical protein